VANLTFSDRCVFGAISAFGGLLVGDALALVLLYEQPHQAFNRSLLLFSVVYFFFAGFVLGARAADLFAGATEVGVQRAEYEFNPIVTPPTAQKTIPSDTATGLIAVGYVLGAIALGYFA
jgi:hypothetical protein